MNETGETFMSPNPSVRFEIELPIVGKHKRWIAYNFKSTFIIGEIMWNTTWGKYCFFPYPNCIYDSNCMKDISAFMESQSE